MYIILATCLLLLKHCSFSWFELSLHCNVQLPQAVGQRGIKVRDGGVKFQTRELKAQQKVI